MIVEPAAGDNVEDNLNPVGRAYYGFSTLLCTPSSLAQEVGLALGTQAGPARIRDVVATAGFTRFEMVAQTPFNNVYEVAGLSPVPRGLTGLRNRSTMTDMASERGRARLADRTGVVERDGVALAWELYGDGPTTVLLMPTWSIIHSRFWKAQIPYLSRHYRVLSFDGRGNGRSDVPRGAAAYSNATFAADTVAVMDATGTDTAVLVALSCAASWSVHVAADHPARVEGLFAIGPSCGLQVAHPARERYTWTDAYDVHRGWAKYNRRYWLEGDFEDFRRFFFAEMFNEPHSTKQIEDALGWSAEITPEMLVDSTAGRLGLDGAELEPLEPLCARVRCPVTVLHGTEDRIRPHAVGERLAALTGGSLVLVEGGGHGLPSREPVLVNTLIREFVDRIAAPPPRRQGWTRARNRRRRALYLSSPIGLGHACRDLAIVRELRTLHPDLEVDWLAQDPVTRVLEGAGSACTRPRTGWPASPRTSRRRRASTTSTRSKPSVGWTRSWSTTSWSSTNWCRRITTTWWSATSPGTSTTSCTRTRSASAPRSPGSPTSSAGCRCRMVGTPRPD